MDERTDMRTARIIGEQKNGCYGRRDALYTKRDPVSGLFAMLCKSLHLS